MGSIKIMIVEDDNEWSEGITNFLKKEDDFEIIGCAASRKDAVEFLKLNSVDVILLDINLNGSKLDGIDAISDFRKYSKAEIIMVTSFYDKNLILASIEAGAIHYILKRNFTILPQAIYNVIRNSSPIKILSQEYASFKQKSKLSTLTISEREIFDLMVKGHSHSQIIVLLNKSSNTIRNQIHSILKKLGVKNCREVTSKFGK